jgi:hydroxymethylpyrimidine pyrophosphatase-like HAD family hydrolase
MRNKTKQEQYKLSQTIKFAQYAVIDNLQDSIKRLLTKPLFITGSSDTFTACHFAERLHYQRGNFAKATTPFEYCDLQQSNRDSNLMIASINGSGNDILFAFDLSIKNEPALILNLCLTSESPLAIRSSQYSVTKNIEIPLPLSENILSNANCLIALFILLARGYKYDLSKEKFESNISRKLNTDIHVFLNRLTVPETAFTILNTGWSKPVAIEIEKKIAENAAISSLLIDHRGFMHRKLYQHDKKNAAVIVLVTAEEEYLVNEIAGSLPKNFPLLVLRSKKKEAAATIDLLIKSGYLIDRINDYLNKDAIEPSIQEMETWQKMPSPHLPNTLLIFNEETDLFIQRKINPVSLYNIPMKKIKKWEKALNCFKKTISETDFGAIVLDYDRTICSDENPLAGPTEEIKKELVKLLKAGFIVGIATGRGESVKKDLQKCISKKYWKKIIIGYYNGAEIGELSNNALPGISDKIHPDLVYIRDLLNELPIIDQVKITGRPFQLTIQNINSDSWDAVKAILYQKTMLARDQNFLILESSRSIDIIKRPEVSKVNIIPFIKEQLKKKKLAENCLCMGDKGKWPGNDFELLNTPYSLSVNEVSADTHTCWNLAPAGIRNTDASLLYLKKLILHKDHFKMHLS